MSNDALCLLIGILLAYIGDVVYSIINYFLQKAFFYRRRRKFYDKADVRNCNTEKVWLEFHDYSKRT